MKLPELLDARARWRGPALAVDRSWIQPLEAAERAELSAAAEALQERPLAEIGRVPLPALSAAVRRWRAELRDGIGFVLVRGVPVEGRGEAAITRMFWLLGRELGEAVPQNGAGDLVCHVRDTGADPADVNTRLYTTRAEQDFHTDGADIIGLLALRGARSGGVSRIVSSVSVFEAVARQRPDLAELLFEEWFFHLHGEFPPGFPAYFQMPICRWDGRHLATFFLGWYIRRAQSLPDVPRLTAAREELLALYEATANDPALYLDMEFQPGDLQWLKNSVILHKRTAYEDHEDPAQKRHLLRLWLTARDFEDGDERLRAGMGSGGPDRDGPGATKARAPSAPR
ncbi:MAG: TauD/TfdA family dioxygenase [Myxococcales bacterium]|nr:TauD/TfdA family dioxygenase [Myxococcales bacterium]